MQIVQTVKIPGGGVCGSLMVNFTNLWGKENKKQTRSGFDGICRDVSVPETPKNQIKGVFRK